MRQREQRHSIRGATSSKPLLVIVGGGGHAKVIFDIFAQVGEYEIVGFTSLAVEPAQCLGYPRLGADDHLPHLLSSGIRHAFVALGDNRRREAQTKYLKQHGFRLANAISPDARVSLHSRLGEGVAIMPGAIVGPEATVAEGAIVNTNASVDHDCVVGPYAHVAPGCALAGGVRLGEGVLFGIGSVAIPNVSVGAWSVVGAGSVVVRDIPDGVVAMGSPARIKGQPR